MPRDNRTIPLPYADRFAAVAGTLPGHELPWLRDLRAQAIERVRQIGIPTIRNERWKYTNLGALAAIAFEPAAAEVASGSPVALPPPIGGYRAVFVDGVYRTDLSAGILPQGVTLTSLRELIGRHPDRARALLSEFDSGEALAALNLAFALDGYVVELGTDVVVEGPIELLHLGTPSTAPSA